MSCVPAVRARNSSIATVPYSKRAVDSTPRQPGKSDGRLPIIDTRGGSGWSLRRMGASLLRNGRRASIWRAGGSSQGVKLNPARRRWRALARELNEELAIRVSGPPRPLMRLRHTYGHGEVLLDMWVVTRYEGEPQGMDGQAMQWRPLKELESLAELLPADRPVIRALRLPAELVDASTCHFEINWFIPDQAAPADRTCLDKLQGLFCRHPEKLLSARSIEGC